MQKIALITIIKLFSFKKGSLFIGSSLLAIPSTIGVNFYLDNFHKNYEVDKILISLVIWIGFTFIFSFFSFGDLVTGVQAALFLNKEKKDPESVREVIKSKKMWATIWKGFAVFMITAMLCFASVVAVLLKSDIIYFAAIYMLCTFSIMACGFEFYSIGENTAKMNNGKKKEIYVFFGKLLSIIENRIIKRVENQNFDK